jgi:hypothetical protein
MNQGIKKMKNILNKCPVLAFDFLKENFFDK